MFLGTYAIISTGKAMLSRFAEKKMKYDFYIFKSFQVKMKIIFSL